MHKQWAVLIILVSFVEVSAGQNPDDLIKRLGAPEARERRLAAEALGKQRVEAALPALAELFKDKDATVRRTAAEALAKMGAKSIPTLAKALSSPDATSRLAALEALYEMDEAAKVALESITQALTDSEVDVRMQAARVLDNLGNDAKSSIPALTAAAKDAANLKRSQRLLVGSCVADAAILAALKIDANCRNELAKEVVPALTPGLKSSDEATVQAASYALLRLGPAAQDALPALKAAQEKAKGDIARTIALAISAIDEGATLAMVIRDTSAPRQKRVQAMEWMDLRPPSKAALDAVIAVLKDPDPHVRLAAASVIRNARTEIKAAIPSLIEMLGDEALKEVADTDRPAEFDVIARALARMGKDAVLPLIDVLEDKTKSHAARWDAIKALSLLGRQARPALPALEAATRNRSAPAVLAIEAAGAYVRAGGDEARPLLMFKAGLMNSSLAILDATARAVPALGTRALPLAPGLIALLDHKEEELRILASEALCQSGPGAKAAIPVLAKRLREGSVRERYRIARALEGMGPDAADALPALIEQLQEERWPYSINPVLTTIGKLGPLGQDAVPTLVEMLKREDYVHHDEVMTTLGQIGPDARLAIAPLRAYLQHDKASTRASAARVLGQIGTDAETISSLKYLLEDEDKHVRVWAAFALAKHSGESERYVKFLIDLWEEARPRPGFGGGNVRYYATRAFALLGESARAALPHLLDTVGTAEKSWTTRSDAVKAVCKMNGEAGLVVPQLTKFLEQPDPGLAIDREAYVQAIQTLGAFGDGAKEAIPVLRRLQDHRVVAIADAATHALSRLDPK